MFTIPSSAIELTRNVKVKAVTYKCDVIVMASHGRPGIKRLLLGGETQHVLTHSHIPVLILRQIGSKPIPHQHITLFL